MKKIIISTIIVSIFFLCTPFVSNKTLANELSIRDFINYLIIIGVIPPDKIPAVNIYLASLNNSPTSFSTSTTTITPVVNIRKPSGGGGGGGGGSNSQTYTVTYDSNGGTGGTVPIDSNIYRTKSIATALDNSGSLVKTGYIFDKWNTQANGGGIDYVNSSTFVIGSASVILYAKWVPVYSITYNGNNNSSGSTPTDSNNYLANTTVTFLENSGSLVKTNYGFVGWNTQADGLGTNYSVNSTSTITSNITLYAQWTPAPSLTVSLDSSSPDTSIVMVDDNSSTNDIVMLSFKLKAEDSDITVSQITVNLAASSTSGNTTLEDLLDELSLQIDGEEFTSDAIFNPTNTQNITFSLDTPLIIDDGNTAELRTYANINSLDGNFNQNDSLKVDFVDVLAEDSNGDAVTEIGSANGNIQTFMSHGVLTTKISESYVAYNELGPTDGIINLKFEIEAFGEDATINEDASNVLHYITGATETGVVITSTNESATGGVFTISDGDVANFTLSTHFNNPAGLIRLTITNVNGSAVSNINTNLH
jgi:uncharacterized repeat protein (TIGR02543 family)